MLVYLFSWAYIHLSPKCQAAVQYWGAISLCTFFVQSGTQQLWVIMIASSTSATSIVCVENWRINRCGPWCFVYLFSVVSLGLMVTILDFDECVHVMALNHSNRCLHCSPFNHKCWLYCELAWDNFTHQVFYWFPSESIYKFVLEKQRMSVPLCINMASPSYKSFQRYALYVVVFTIKLTITVRISE